MLFPQVLDIIAPPYTSEFVQLFLPMVETEEITGGMRGDNDSDPVSEFIGERHLPDLKSLLIFKLLIYIFFVFQFIAKPITY